MTISPYIIILCIAVAAASGLMLILRWTHRRGVERAKAEAIREANRLIDVWICRYCGLMSMIRNEECIWCNAARPEEYIARSITTKEFGAQVRKAQPSAHAGRAGSGDL